VIETTVRQWPVGSQQIDQFPEKLIQFLAQNLGFFAPVIAFKAAGAAGAFN
jgi:hypothetical protein